MLKNVLAGSLVVFMMGLGCSFALADSNYSDNAYAPATAPAEVPSTTFNQKPQYNNDIPLRGHIIAIPQGTMMMIRLDHPISSYSSKVGDPVSATVESDVYLGDQVVIPTGSKVEGSVTGATAAGHLGRPGSLELHFYGIKTSSGLTIPLRAHVVTDDASGVIKGDSAQAQVLKTLGTAVGATATGTLLGTAAGSILGSAASGAAFGVAAGSIAGIGYAIVRQGKQVVIPTGARMSIMLDQPVAVNQPF